jgi:4-hydroxybenzoate polyprenyltransferase
MNVFSAFFKLIRWPNLFFIFLTQVLFRFFVLRYVYNGTGQETYKLSLFLFFLLATASIFIAAAGYIINDYFDLKIDLVNKPTKLIIDRYIKRRWAIALHLIFSGLGLLISIYVGFKLHNFYMPFFNLLAIVALWFYSTTFKKKLLVGNIIISLLTAWVIFVLTVSEYRFSATPQQSYWKHIIKFSFIYGGFAFIISIIREVIKDMEDLTGDSKYGCTTMPIVWGLPASKVFVAVWLIVVICAAMAIQIYVIQLGWWPSAVYSLLTIIIPLVWVLRKLYFAQSPADFHKLSNAVKVVMLTGILSMAFF